MPTVPSIKGSVLAGHAEVLSKYLASNPVSPEVLAERFPDGELEILSRPISASGWYEIRIYQRVLEFLRDYQGGGSNAYLIAAGARSAENLLKARYYQQLEYLGRTQLAARHSASERSLAFGRDLRLLVTLNQSIFNFVRTEVKQDPEHPDRWQVEYHNAEAFPEVLCWTNQGFNNRMGAEHDTPELWRWERPRPDLVVFRMTRSV